MSKLQSKFNRYANTLMVCSAMLAAGCTSNDPQPQLALNVAVEEAAVATSKNITTDAQPNEYFSESDYQVKASPRVAHSAQFLRRGGGRAHIGKPYQIRGVWYYPKDQPGYSKTGKASWYGKAFHGRLTANGEVYDMNHLSAAHPTLPLPSYARVTNLKNGHSIIVRINDRGPFAHGRVIDVSKKAAELLNFKHEGIGRVKVDYIGRAPLHGKDEDYLFGSLRQGSRVVASNTTQIPIPVSAANRKRPQALPATISALNPQ